MMKSEEKNKGAQKEGNISRKRHSKTSGKKTKNGQTQESGGKTKKYKDGNSKSTGARRE